MSLRILKNRCFQLLLVCTIISIVVTYATAQWQERWENTTIEGFNQKLTDMGFKVGSQEVYRNPYSNESIFIKAFTNSEQYKSTDVSKQPFVVVESANEWLQINRNCSFYSVCFQEWSIQPVIYWKPIYSTVDNPNDAEFWFSNGTTVFTLWNWQYALNVTTEVH
jgi:hypothetical protein